MTARELADLRQVNEDLRKTRPGQDEAPSLPAADDPTSSFLLDSFLKRMTCDAVAVDDSDKEITTVATTTAWNYVIYCTFIQVTKWSCRSPLPSWTRRRACGACPHA